MKAILVFILWMVGLYILDLNSKTDQKHDIILGLIGWMFTVLIPIIFFANFF